MSGADTTNVTFQGADASACAGVFSALPADLGLGDRTGFTPFSLVAGSLTPTSSVPASGSGSIDGISFNVGVSITDPSFLSAGTWSLDWTLLGLPIDLDIVAVIQTSIGSWTSYLFSDLLFSASGSGTGAWVINLSDLSLEVPASLISFSLYAREPIPTTEPPPTPVSEPSGIAVASLGLALVLVASHRTARRQPRDPSRRRTA